LPAAPPPVGFRELPHAAEPGNPAPARAVRDGADEAERGGDQHVPRGRRGYDGAGAGSAWRPARRRGDRRLRAGAAPAEPSAADGAEYGADSARGLVQRGGHAHPEAAGGGGGGAGDPGGAAPVAWEPRGEGSGPPPVGTEGSSGA